MGARLVARVLAEVRPDTVLTFGPDGLTGHADHRDVSRWVTRAWHEAGCPGRLWYAALTADFLTSWGETCAEFYIWMDGGAPAPAHGGALAHVQVCTGDVLDRKCAALVAHRSQTARLIDQVGPERYGSGGLRRPSWRRRSISRRRPDRQVRGAAAASALVV